MLKRLPDTLSGVSFVVDLLSVKYPVEFFADYHSERLYGIRPAGC
jgi:hypothetical protein